MEKHYYQDALQRELEERMRRNPHYSLRAFADSLEINSGAFSQILSGKRKLSLKVAKKLLQKLQLSPSEQDEFLSSVAQAHLKQGSKRTSLEMKKFLETQMKKALQISKPREISHDLFNVIAEWYHYALLILLETKGCKHQTQWMAKQLGITTLEAKLGLQRLQDVGLIKKQDDKWTPTHKFITTADKNFTNSALKNRQKQILEKSIHSLTNDPLEVRNHSAMTFAMDPADIPEAKERIEKFIVELTQDLEQKNKKQVYEITINLFPLQKGETK